jgi:hypothetical protein
VREERSVNVQTGFVGQRHSRIPRPFGVAMLAMKGDQQRGRAAIRWMVGINLEHFSADRHLSDALAVDLCRRVTAANNQAAGDRGQGHDAEGRRS